VGNQLGHGLALAGAAGQRQHLGRKAAFLGLVHHDRDDHLRVAEFTAGFGSCLAARMRRRNAELCSTCSGATSRVQIRRVAQAVAEEVEGEDHEDHRDHGQHEPGVEDDDIDVLSLDQEHAPGGDRRAQAQAEEGERGPAR
jgi:hypothetical protein